MGLFGKLFDKKVCDICGGEIGLLGNRKLEDGNLCKNCAAKLSPWFSDRRSSTVEQIRGQLNYREANQRAVAQFHTTRTLGARTKVLVDENAGKFMVTSARNLAEANPDVIDLTQVTGCRLDIDESKSELKRKDAEGKQVSYNPPKYEYRYNFTVIIDLNAPYFDEIRFRLNDSSIEITPPPTARFSSGGVMAFARNDVNFAECEKMGNEIVDALLGRRGGQAAPQEAAQPEAAPREPVECPFCGAKTVPDAQGLCEYCGSRLK